MKVKECYRCVALLSCAFKLIERTFALIKRQLAYILNRAA